jgi:hypothetical protein
VASVTATKIQDASGNLMPSGTITFQPTVTPFQSFGFCVEGITAAIAAGAVSVSVEPGTYNITITNSVTGNSATLTKVVIPTTGLNLDAYSSF